MRDNSIIFDPEPPRSFKNSDDMKTISRTKKKTYISADYYFFPLSGRSSPQRPDPELCKELKMGILSIVTPRLLRFFGAE